MCASSRVAGDAWGGNHGPGPGPVCRVLVCFVGFRFVGGVCVASTLSVYCDCVSVCAVCVCVCDICDLYGALCSWPYAVCVACFQKNKKNEIECANVPETPHAAAARGKVLRHRGGSSVLAAASLRGATIIPSVVMRYQLGMWRRLRLQVCSGGASEGAQRVTHGRHRHP